MTDKIDKPGPFETHGKEIAKALGAMQTNCDVNRCSEPVHDVVEIKPFDPIDHPKTLRLSLCEGHCNWAASRNAFAETMTRQLRKKRAELAEEHFADIKELEEPNPNPEVYE